MIDVEEPSVGCVMPGQVVLGGMRRQTEQTSRNKTASSHGFCLNFCVQVLYPLKGLSDSFPGWLSHLSSQNTRRYDFTASIQIVNSLFDCSWLSSCLGSILPTLNYELNINSIAFLDIRLYKDYIRTTKETMHHCVFQRDCHEL